MISICIYAVYACYMYVCTSTWVHVLTSTVAHSKGALTLLDEFVSPVFGPEKWILWVYPRPKHAKRLKIKINVCLDRLDPTKKWKQSMNLYWHRAGIDLDYTAVLYQTRSDSFSSFGSQYLRGKRWTWHTIHTLFILRAEVQPIWKHNNRSQMKWDMFNKGLIVKQVWTINWISSVSLTVYFI